MSAPLLVEIGLEELPPTAMRPLADELTTRLCAALEGAGFERGPAARYATPRRLAVVVAEVADRARAETVEKYGPTTDIAFTADGTATAAAHGFAASMNADVAALAREATPKGERLVYRSVVAGAVLHTAFDKLLRDAVAGLRVPKRMRWGKIETPFVRPVHWLTALHGDAILACRLFEVDADRTTRGHLFHHPGPIELGAATDYAPRLAYPGWVIADPDVRAASVRDQVNATAEAAGGEAIAPDWLVEEVNALVEYPVALAGAFDDRYLTLPREVLIAAMQKHQRYFAIQGADGSLRAGFVAVANIASREPAQVVAGNERVIRPRLDDALFFWNQDQARGLDALVPGLARVTFERSLGTLADKSERLRQIATRLGPAFGVDAARIDRIATLAKTDLLTAMVDEFPELQGVMGGYYARSAGDDEAVARAIAEQYAPAAAAADIAETPAGRLIAVADRLDTLAGIFAIGKAPSGDKDPYALRRAALGVVRTLIESGVDVALDSALASAASAQPVALSDALTADLYTFHVERMRSYYTERGVQTAVFDAVAAVSWQNPVDFDRRLRAAQAFVREPSAVVVCAAHKRIRNLLRRESAQRADWAREHLSETAELRLADTLGAAVDAAPAADYHRALLALGDFAEPLEAFFDQVRVVVDDPEIRRNRLALLAALDRHFCAIADISRLTPAPGESEQTGRAAER